MSRRFVFSQKLSNSADDSLHRRRKNANILRQFIQVGPGRQQRGKYNEFRDITLGRDAKQPLFRVRLLRGLPALLRKLNCQPEAVVERVDVDLGQLDDPDLKLPYILGGMLLERCVSATGCDHLGLLLGTDMDPSTLGLSGFILKAAPDVQTALRSLKQNLELHDEGGELRLEVGDSVSTLEYRITVQGVPAEEQILDFSIANATRIMRAMCGDDWKPTKVFLSRRPPRIQADYRCFFRAPVQFSADRNAIVFPTFWLRYKLAHSDPMLFEYLQQTATELHRQRHEDLIQRLHKTIRRSLPTQACRVGNVAQHMGMHLRTLERRLKERGTSFRIERDRVRYQIAGELLSRDNTTNTQIAYLLGYSGDTAFNRSFKRWSGLTPKQWRKVMASH